MNKAYGGWNGDSTGVLSGVKPVPKQHPIDSVYILQDMQDPVILNAHRAISTLLTICTAAAYGTSSPLPTNARRTHTPINANQPFGQYFIKKAAATRAVGRNAGIQHDEAEHLFEEKNPSLIRRRLLKSQDNERIRSISDSTIAPGVRLIVPCWGKASPASSLQAPSSTPCRKSGTRVRMLDMLRSVARHTQHTHHRLVISGWAVLSSALLSQIASTRASPVETAGPLGSSPGNSPGTIPAGNSGNDTSASGTTFSTAIRALDTVLAAFAALLITITYAVLIGPGARLSSTSKLPLASIEGNIGNLLSKTWPDTSNSTDVGAASESGDAPDAIRLLYVGKMDDEQARAARGVKQCEAIPEDRVVTPPLWLTTGSVLTKSMVQLAVWEWISIWMAIAMLVSTLAFNGFFTNNTAPDSFPRLVVVAIYMVSFCVHAWYVWKKCRSFFTLASAGASWSMLNKASFASVGLEGLNNRLSGGPSPVFKQVGKPSSSTTYPTIEACLFQDISLPRNEIGVADATSADEQKGAAETVSAWQKREVTSTVEGGNAALDLIVTNVMTMVGITITTGFSVWTSNTSSDSSQLGSLALLASLTLGTGAMFSSAVHLSIMDSSFKNMLYLKEVMINGQASAHVTKRPLNKRVIGFTHKSVDAKPVRMRDLAKISRLWSLVMFGPAHTLLPSEEDHTRQSKGASFELHVKVRDEKVILTTERTNRHSKRADSANVEAINVFYTPKSKSLRPAQQIVKPEGQAKSTATSWASEAN